MRIDAAATPSAFADPTKFPVATLACSELKPRLDRKGLEKAARKDTNMYDYLVWVAGYASKKEQEVIFDPPIITNDIVHIVERCAGQPDVIVTAMAEEVIADASKARGATATAFKDAKCETIGAKAISAGKVEAKMVRHLWMWLSGYYAPHSADTVFDLKHFDKYAKASNAYCAKHREASIADVAKKFDEAAN